MDQLRQIVFEEALALGLKERDDLLVIRRVGCGEAEIDLLAALVDRHALEAEGDGAVLDGRVGDRIEDLEPKLAAGERSVLLEHLAHPLRVERVGRDLCAEALRIVEAHCDRLVDLDERLARTIREGEETLLGEVDSCRAQCLVGDDIDADEEDRGADQSDDCCDGAVHFARLNPLS